MSINPSMACRTEEKVSKCSVSEMPQLSPAERSVLAQTNMWIDVEIAGLLGIELLS
ncbi:hypothetical protein [Cupriavidus pauculus]|uniref:hypothetical protein n=1 Tax=Cupriavidus pauculus TaxID=82633 RepID=UPI000AC7CE7B|nr:hypothetical protein [Cupriavidus pauculus]